MRAHEFITESLKTASAEQVWKYVSGIHPENQQGGGFLKRLIMRHPQYELRRIPLSSINIPDQEYDDEEQQEPYDPYGRAMFVDPEHAGEYSQHYIDKRPIVIDTRGNILDGSHRAWAAAMLMNKKDIMAYVPVPQLNELGNSPSEYKPNRKRKRSLFHATVDGNWVDVFFDRSEFNGTLHITFTVNGDYDTPSQPTSASKSTVKILSTVLNIIKKQLPEYIIKARPPGISFTSKQDNRASLYRKYFVPVIQNILGSKWQHEEYPSMGMTVFHWKPVKKQDVTEGRGVKQEIEEFLYSLSPDDVGVEEFPGYRIHYEGFTDECKSSIDYQKNPNRVYKQVYQDFIDREGGKKPAKSGMVGDEEYPILYSVFQVPQSKTIDTAEKAYSIAYKKKQPWPRGSREEKLIRSNWQLSGLYDQYVLNKQNVTEAFDQPYAVQWTKQNGDWHATADLDDGSELVVLFMSQGDNQWMVEFERDENMEITGEGDAQRVFATVLTAMRQFIARRKPAMVNFSAEKEDDPTGSRARLYDRMVQRYITGTGYNLTREDMPGGATYTLTKQVQGVAENFADGRNPQDKGDSKRYGVPTKASVSTLRRVAKQGGRKGQLAHWLANMKAGRAKAKKK